jgi:hypothetical protein
MRITVSYHVRDIYDVPVERWLGAMCLCGNDEDDALNLLLEADKDVPYKTDVTDRYVEADKE